MKETSKYFCSPFVLGLLVILLAACTPTKYDGERETQDFLAKETAGVHDPIKEFEERQAEEKKATELPARFQSPTFLLDDADEGFDDMASEFSSPVGANISSNVPVPLREVMKQLAKSHDMNISWANDVEQNLLVDVQIRAEDDFFTAVDNILRQLDYHYEIQGRTLVVKYQQTRRFYIAIPALNATYSSGVGGDVLGGAGGDSDGKAHAMKGLLSLENTLSEGEPLDVWKSIKLNLDKILQKMSTEDIERAEDLEKVKQAGEKSAIYDVGAAEEEGSQQAAKVRTISRVEGVGYYVIDKSVGLITVTAPLSTMEKIASYLDTIKKELYRQVSIEAKIIEVTLTADNRTGLDWSKLLEQTDELGNGFGLNLDFQKLNPLYYSSGTQNRFLTMNNKSFELFLDAMKQQGHVEVLSNPRINVMNGQPAMISIGTTIRYIEDVSVDVDSETGYRTYTATPGTVMSGLGLGVVATILDNERVVLNLTPVTSSLEEDPIETQTFGDGGVIGLPRVRIREMNTNASVQNGELLVVGGLIDNRKAYDEDKVAGGLGDAGKVFKTSGDQVQKSELVIVLRPVIHNM